MVSRMSTDTTPLNIREVTRIVYDAGPQGILAADVADRFIPTEGDRDLQQQVNLVLSRSTRAGYIRRSLKREMPRGLHGASRKSFRWRITQKGVQYVNGPTLPDITPRGEGPNLRGVMEVLAEAGEAGILGPAVGRHFTLAYAEGSPRAYLNGNPMQNLQRRMNWTNQILHRLAAQGYAERGTKEASPYYHRVPAYRWFITDKGREYLAGGLAEGRRKRREDEKYVKARLRQERARNAARLVTEAYEKYDPDSTPACVRNQAIRDLRGAGCSLDAVGGVFGITRERVRQILSGVSISCRCPKHAKKNTGVGWPA